MTGKMHADEIEIDVPLVRGLIAVQFPQWADLELEAVRSAGTDNAIFRLGSEMSVRLPRIRWAVEQTAKEQKWLPCLAPYLPLSVPTPLAGGRPALSYPWSWTVCSWLPGENVEFTALADPAAAACSLASFINALQRIDIRGGPPPGSHNSHRGVQLVERDELTRDAIARAADLIDAARLLDAWQAAVKAPAWQSSPVWIHGDLQPGNLLQHDGEIRAVIDFGCLGVGDPACDLMPAWNLFTSESRESFRQALHVDEATWERGRGWALSVAVVALPYYLHTNPVLAALARRTIDAVLAVESS